MPRTSRKTSRPLGFERLEDRSMLDASSLTAFDDGIWTISTENTSEETFDTIEFREIGSGDQIAVFINDRLEDFRSRLMVTEVVIDTIIEDPLGGRNVIGDPDMIVGTPFDIITIIGCPFDGVDDPEIIGTDVKFVDPLAGDPLPGDPPKADRRFDSMGEDELIETTGTVVYNFLEGGFYGIRTDDGKFYDPSNLALEYQIAGLRVTFRAITRPNAGTFHMAGTVIDILEISREGSQGESPGETAAHDHLKGNNGLGNGVDPAPPGLPPENDGAGTAPGYPGNKPVTSFQVDETASTRFETSISPDLPATGSRSHGRSTPRSGTVDEDGLFDTDAEFDEQSENEESTVDDEAIDSIAWDIHAYIAHPN